MRYDILKIMVFPYVFYSIHPDIYHDFTMAYPMTYKCYPFETWRGYQYCNIQVARGNGCFHEIIRIIKLCDWPERSSKVKSVMAQYLKIHFIRYTNYVQSFMLLSKSAQLQLT